MMSKFDPKELSPRGYSILKLIERYAESRHTCGTCFINKDTHNMWEILEDVLTDQVRDDVYSTELCKVCDKGTAHLMRFCDSCGSEYGEMAPIQPEPSNPF